MSDYIEEGDLVSIRSRKGWIEAVVVSVRGKRTGGSEIKLNSSIGDLNFQSKDGTYDPRIITFVRKGDTDLTQIHQDERSQREDERSDKQEDAAEIGRQALEKLKLNHGDVVIIDYTNGSHVETVNGVNWKTGKVGLLRKKHRTQEEEMALAVSFANMNRLTGRNLRPPLERDTRWVPANLVSRIVRRFAGT